MSMRQDAALLREMASGRPNVLGLFPLPGRGLG